MRLLIIRHGDPDYAVDGLTEKGKTEAQLLKSRLINEHITKVYCSVYGRARLTIQPTLDAKNMTAEYFEWLREFDFTRIKLPYLGHKKIPWDILPEYLQNCPDIYSVDKWMYVDFIKNSNLYAEYTNVCNEFDKILLKHGYKRENAMYKAIEPNKDTLIFTCHFGLASVLISHLMHCSPYSLWEHTCLPPSSVTTFYTEERKPGVVKFRASGIGDISHLYAAGQPAAFAGRFCETFESDERH